MLKINLLPPYIYEGKTRKTWVAVWILLVVGVVAGMLFWQKTINDDAQHWKDEQAKITNDADTADRLKREADAINGESAGIRAKNDFVNNAKTHNLAAYKPVYDNVNAYTYNRVVYSAVTPSGGQVNISAIAPTLVDVGHYVMSMEHNEKIRNVSINVATEPFGAGQAQAQGGGGRTADGGPPSSWHPFTVVLTLAQPIPGAPSFGGAGGGAAGGGGAGGPAPGGAATVPAPGAGKKLPGGGSA